MSSILIKNVLHQEKKTDIAITGNRISRIAPGIDGKFETVIDGSHLAAFPPFYNTHCHAAMTLLRGLADDMELFDWLQNHIWPAEAKLTHEFVYWGSKLACMEMIRSGTVFFNDMYFKQKETIRAVEETGIRAAIGLISLQSPAGKTMQQENGEILAHRNEYSSRIQLTWAPHAIYTVGREQLCRIVGDAAEQGLRIHIHLAETQTEVKDSLKEHGLTPTAYLDKLGVLTERTLAAHAIHLTDEDIEIIRSRGVYLAYMPCSNYKLSSGRFRFHDLMERGVNVTLGTDGCASNNNLSMFDEMKSGALGAKLQYGGPTGCSAEQLFTAATRTGAQAFGIDAGVVEEGRLADIMLIDLDSPMMVADHNLISNLVYSADSSCVRTVICDGRILMRDREIPGLAETVENARRCAHRLVGK